MPTFPAIIRNPSVFVREIEPPLPREISAIPRNIICVASVTIIGGSSVKFVSTSPLIRPHAVPTSRHTSTTAINGISLLHAIQVIVAERHTVAPTEISISPRINTYAIGSMINASARYLGISLNTFSK